MGVSNGGGPHVRIDKGGKRGGEGRRRRAIQDLHLYLVVVAARSKHARIRGIPTNRIASREMGD